MAEVRACVHSCSWVVGLVTLLGCSGGGSGGPDGAYGEGGGATAVPDAPAGSPDGPRSGADGAPGDGGSADGSRTLVEAGSESGGGPDDAASPPQTRDAPDDYLGGAGIEVALDGRVAVDVADAPAAFPCQPGLTRCGELCVNTETDPDHCGACFTACGGGRVCAGTCSCPAGKTDCNGLCTDTATDPNNCLACGTVCTGGKICDFVEGCECPGVTTDCFGVCVALGSNPLHCGACGKTCGTGLVCTAGSCECPSGQTRCGDGSCVDLLGDDLNCGTCGHTCDAGQVCTAGRCICAADRTDCGNGTCADLMADPANCGACGTTCGSGYVCSGGTCARECASGLANCNGACLDLQTSEANCGSCAHACSLGGICDAGQCRCPLGRSDCAGVCVDLQTEIGNCGSCGHLCPAASRCQAGTCTCDPGYDLCGDACIDTQWNNDHCGSCTNACRAETWCSQGTCVCPSPQIDCNGTCVNPLNDSSNCGGCGKVCTVGTCAGGVCSCPLYETPCDGRCIPTANDPANCGACGHVCTSGQVCLSSACTSNCYGGLTACSGTCVDTTSDRNHCGSCTNVCGSGQGCAGGICVPSVPVGIPPAKCANGGPPILLTADGTTPTCAGATAATTFPWAICTCDSFTGKGSQSFDAFDSASAPYVAGGLGGGVGVNGTYSGGSSLSCTGTLWSLQSIDPGNATVLQELHAGGVLAGNVQVTGTGYVVTPQGRGSFAGDLYAGSCPATGYTVGGSCHADPALAVPAPCQRCDGASQVPVQAYVAYYAVGSHNDNGAIGLSSSVFSQGGAAAVLDLPCGYYYLERIVAEDSVTITAHGNTALFVGGGIDVKGALVLTLDATSRFDIFVAGTIYADGTLNMGSAAYPANLRVYVGGTCKSTGSSCVQKADCCSSVCTEGMCSEASLLPSDPPWAMYMKAATNIAAGLYIPNGEMYAGASFAMYGAIFAGDYKANGSTTIHYDRAAVNQDKGCPPTTTGCGSCLDCGNQACVKGVCGECTSDSQCCPPLVCAGGRCVLGG